MGCQACYCDHWSISFLTNFIFTTAKSCCCAFSTLYGCLSELNLVCGIQPLKIPLFPEFIKYLLDKIFLVQLTFLHILSQSTVYIIILLIVFSSSVLPSQFTSYLFVMPCLRRDLSTGYTNKDIVLGDICPTGRYNLQKAAGTSCLQDQTLRVQTTVLSSPYFLGACSTLWDLGICSRDGNTGL